MIQKKALTADALLLLTSALWGFAFVAQRTGMDYLGPFIYNALRFALGGIVLLPILLYRSRRRPKAVTSFKTVFLGSLLSGVILFIAASLQQIGMIYTDAGKAGFITGFYVVLVPIIGISFGHRAGLPTWIGAVLAVIGLYFLSNTGGLSMGRGDLFILAAAVFWAFHVLCIDHYSKRIDPLILSLIQYTWCSLFSVIVAFTTEEIAPSAILAARAPILYSGICSVGIAYTLQVVAQRNAPAAHAAIIMNMESVFAVIGGMAILGETLSGRGWTGCTVIFSGILISQWEVLIRRERTPGRSGRQRPSP